MIFIQTGNGQGTWTKEDKHGCWVGTLLNGVTHNATLENDKNYICDQPTGLILTLPSQNILTANTTLIKNKNYICNNPNGLNLILPSDSNLNDKDTIIISTMKLNPNKFVTINTADRLFYQWS